MMPTKLHRDSVRLRSVGPLLLRRGARLLFEHVFIPALRPVAKLGFFGREQETSATPPTTSWVPRHPSGEGSDQ